MKKVLIISYYWPPTGGAGVQRWLKFVKYLPHYNWEPVVYTPENPESPEMDPSLLKDVPAGLTLIKTPIWEPFQLYKRFIGKGKNEKIQPAFLQEEKRNPFTENLSVRIRGNYFIPDARKFWIKPSVKFLNDYLLEFPVDLVISTGPPHSMHMIAMQVAANFQIPWIADFRDPWTNIDFYKDLKLSRFADRKHRRLELEVLRNASSLVVISRSMADDFRIICDREYDVITNGYDEPDSSSLITNKLDQKFSIAHIGSLVGTRNPRVLWKALKEIISENEDFRNDLEIKLVGRVDFSALESIRESGLSSYLNKIDYLHHDEVVNIQQRSQLLLLLINNTPNAKSILTGKFFEYLAARRPILCIGPPDGDASRILSETMAGQVAGFDDIERTKKIILEYYQLYRQGKLVIESKNIEQFSRKALTGKMAEIMNRLTA